MADPLRDFIKANLTLFLSSNTGPDDWKRAKHEFFVDKMRNRMGVPKNSELATGIVEFCVESGAIQSIDRLQSIVEASGFLSRYLNPRERDALMARLKQGPTPVPVLRAEELRRIHHEEYRKQKESELAAAAQSQVDSKLAEVEALRVEATRRYERMFADLEAERRQFEAEKSAVKASKSALDPYLDTPLDQIPYSGAQPSLSTVPSDRIVWWDRLGLRSNPFPTVDGLSEIDDIFHDEIVLRTPVFQHYQELLRTSPAELLGKTHVITGEFGCGKTTLFDFLKKPLITRDLLPLHLLLDAESEKDEIRRNFYRAVLHEVTPLYVQATGQHPLLTSPIVGKEEVSDALRAVLAARHLNGVVVMIDGLHKNDSHRIEALGFIQTLQNSQDYWTRNGVRVGFLIAGSKAWELDLSMNAVTRGTVDHFERIGAISPSDAFDMLSKRMQAFSKDAARPARVRRPAIERVCKQLQAKYPRDLTFRDVVEEIQPYLERTDTGFVEISLPFDKDLLRKLRASVESFPPFAEAIGRLRKRPDAFLPALQLLSVLLEKSRIGESHPTFNDNQALFAILAKAGLIQKVHPSGTPEFFWVPSRPVLDFGKKSELELGHPPSEFLYEIFLDRPEDRLSSSEAPEIALARRLEATFSTADRDLANSVRASVDAHQPLLEHAMAPTDLIPREELCAIAENSIERVLSVLYLSIESRSRPPFGGVEAQSWLAESRVAPPEVFEFWREVRELGGACPDPIQAATIARAYIRAYRTALSAADRAIRDDSIVNLRTDSLRRADKVAFNDSRTKYSDGLYFDCTRVYTDYAESRIREFVYNVLTLKYGPKWRSRLGQDANRYILEQRTRSQSIVHDGMANLNEMYLLTRQHYRQVITEVQGNWTQVFGPAFRPEPKEEIDRALRLIFALSDKDKHNLPNDFFQKNADKVRSGLEAAARVVIRINEAYPRLLDTSHVLVEPGDQGRTQVIFSFLGGTDRTNLVPVRINHQDGNRMAANLVRRLRTGPVRLDLGDFGAVSGLLDGGYREALAVIAVAAEKGYVTIESQDAATVSLRLGRAPSEIPDM